MSVLRGGDEPYQVGPVSRAKEAVFSRLWPVPTVMVSVAVVAGYLTPRVEQALDDGVLGPLERFVFSGGPDAARGVLASIAGSLITVTSLTFSLTVVTLQLASSQFTPRLLRTFVSDVFTQVTFGLFIGTFAFALVVLRTVRSPDEGDAFVPRAAVTAAVLLMVVSAGQLVLFIGHLVAQIQVERIVERVRHEAEEALERVLPPLEEAEGAVAPDPPPEARPLLARTTGRVQAVLESSLRDAAVRHHAVVLLDAGPGEPVVAGTPVALAWPAGPEPVDHDALQEALDEGLLVVGAQRTDQQDVEYGLRQLADISARALSPGTNDPTTAVHVLDHVSGVLCRLCGRALEPVVWTDDDDRPRVYARRRSFATVLETALGQTRRYGADEAAVVVRLLRLLREVAWCARTDEQRDAVASQLTRLEAAWTEGLSDSTDRAAAARLGAQVRETLAGRWSPSADVASG